MILSSPVRKPIYEAEWQRPRGNVDFRVTQRFGCTGEKAEPRLGSCEHFHRGIDLGDGDCGSDVLACLEGTVQFAGNLGNGELCVVIDHGQGQGTSYGHLKRIRVSKGQRVLRGTHIGDVGDTGLAAGCHLHLAAKKGLPAGWTKLDFIPNPLGGRGDTTGEWLDPWPRLEQNAGGIDPDLEDVVYQLEQPLEGSSAVIKPNTNIRSTPATTGTPRYSRDGEAWPRVIGFVTGEAVAGETRWLMRWSGTSYEFVHRSQIAGITPPAGDCSTQEARIAELETSLGVVNATLATALAQARATVTTLGGNGA